MNGILQRLRIDAGRKTVGELIQEREAAANEIERLLRKLDEAERQPTGRDVTPDYKSQKGVAGAQLEMRWKERAFLKLADVCAVVGLSRSTVYKRLAEGSFPQPVRLGTYSVRWRSADLEAWIQARS